LTIASRERQKIGVSKQFTDVFQNPYPANRQSGRDHK
jgi:hypothetical protein